ncbi:hypothetical protein RG963_06520 [Methanosarcina sp. Z-7115]|uniref:Uncharacterized protein n=1 Tax=Methanosarcina baikalica TaxID=3073890 RepID=A0ABU2D0D6_9EURY|nr:hypothetical protein [Methanosarcina sp. Z-7115]MDR7665443.1 hypothetical protein [Methanosarcina sp. Z-7115]
MLEIDFKDICPRMGSKEDSFEELCCEIFYRKIKAVRSDLIVYNRNRGAGGDGGVEAYWELTDEKEIGIQCKYVFTYTALIKQLEKSLASATTIHPNLTCYVVCIPFNLTTNTNNGIGESEKFKSWLEKKKVKLNFNFEVYLWSGSYLIDYIIELDKNNGLKNYWFNREIFPKEWFEQRINEAKAQAGERYTPKLSISVPSFEELEIFSNSYVRDEKNKQINSKINEKVEDWNRSYNLKETIKEKISTSHDEIKNNLDEVIETLNKIYTETWNQKENIDLSKKLRNILDTFHNYESLVFEEFKEKGWVDAPSYRQYMMEYTATFPAAHLDSTRDIIICLEQFLSLLTSNKTKLSFSKIVLLKGPAGIGKTHLIIDHALSRKDRGAISLVFYGEDFDHDEPWTTISRKLGLSGNLSRDEFFECLSIASEETQEPVLIYIDALNESKNHKKWKTWFPLICEQIRPYPKILLCVSCRDTYINEIFSDINSISQIDHNGFSGCEFEAITEFFNYYKIEHPTSPLLQKEFTNPLFLHLVCSTLKDKEPSSLPLGQQGFLTVMNSFLRKKNEVISSAINCDPRDNVINKALFALAKSIGQSSSNYIKLDAAKRVVSNILPVSGYTDSLFIHLEKENLVSVIPSMVDEDGLLQHNVRFTFERIQDFFIVREAIKDLDQSLVRDLFKEGNPLYFVLNSDCTENIRLGLLEACSIIIPEKYNVELTEIIDIKNSSFKDDIYNSIFRSFEWRSSKTFFDETRSLVLNQLHQNLDNTVLIDSLLAISTRNDCLLNGEFLHKLLEKINLTTRDPFWNYYIHENYELKRNVYRLIYWAKNANIGHINLESLTLWAIVLSWFCASSDRRIRDQSTLGLTRLFITNPQTITPLISKFNSVDDEYIFERVTLAAYGAILKSGPCNSLKETAETVYYLFLHKKIPCNALIRDNLRLLLEFANETKNLPENTDMSVFRPPYESFWPLEIPKQEIIDELMSCEEFAKIPEMYLGSYRIGTDFARYIVENIFYKFDLKSANITKNDIHNWFLYSVKEMSYPGYNSMCYKYDMHLISKYGGGRGKPTWAERLGKKYYWILYYRLIGILSDNLDYIADEFSDHVISKESSRLQGLNIRHHTMDPTDLRYTIFKKVGSHDWWNPIDYSFSTLRDISPEEWIETLDLPSVYEAIKAFDSKNGQWINLSLSKINKEEGQTQSEKLTGFNREVTTVVRSILVPKKETKHYKKGIKEMKDQFKIYTSSFNQHSYSICLEEYPYSEAVRQDSLYGGLFLELTGILPNTTSAYSNEISMLREKSFDYDFSNDERSETIEFPLPTFISELNLKWNGNSSWVDSSNEEIIINVKNKKCRGLIIREDKLVPLLNKIEMNIIFVVLQEKLIRSTNETHFKLVQKVSHYLYSNGKLSKIYEKEIDR